MDKSIVNEIREQLTTAAKQGGEAVWAVYNTLMDEKGTDWQTLAAITIASSDLHDKSVNCKGSRFADTYRAMNEMVFDYAALHAEEINDYSQFKSHACRWEDQIPIY